jgi:hypothetical protein
MYRANTSRQVLCHDGTVPHVRHRGVRARDTHAAPHRQRHTASTAKAPRQRTAWQRRTFATLVGFLSGHRYRFRQTSTVWIETPSAAAMRRSGQRQR